MEQTIQKKLSVGGGSWLTVDVYGEPEAPGLVLLPGAMSDAHAWRHVASGLDAWPSAAVVNRRGRAPSGPLTDRYSLRTEVEDLSAVLDTFGDTKALFGWSYGGSIALLAADDRPLPHLIAYEPVLPPFGQHALPDLKAAERAGDEDAVVETVLRQVSGLDAAQVEALRSDPREWTVLRRLSGPAHAELAALNAAPPPHGLARAADRVDLIVGQHNRGTAPYGTTFEDVRERLPRAQTHVLPDQGHLGHLQAPTALAHLLDDLAEPADPAAPG